jgi:ATP-binding cassette subfamily D (ALD) long-chain fatty acid import protein
VYPTPPDKFASDARHFPPISANAKPNIDAVFLRQLKAILFRIAFPSVRSKETLIVVLHSFFLVLRTVLSIAVARWVFPPSLFQATELSPDWMGV